MTESFDEKLHRGAPGISRAFDDPDADRSTEPRVPPGLRRRQAARGRVGGGRLMPDDAAGPAPRLPPPPARVSLSGGPPPDGGPSPDGEPPPVGGLVGWDHLMVNGSDAEFRRMLRGLVAVARRMELTYDLAAREFALTGSELEYLIGIAESTGASWSAAARRSAVGRGPSVDASALTRRLDISKSYSSMMSRRLAGRGLIEKFPDPRDAKRRLLVITEAGRALVEAAWPMVRGAHNLAFAPITAGEFKTLRKAAGKLDAASERAVDILARRTGEDPVANLADLARDMRRLGMNISS
jgi:MarR family transcriptional regulator, organic hydroperoxide resistance regulator